LVNIEIISDHSSSTILSKGTLYGFYSLTEGFGQYAYDKVSGNTALLGNSSKDENSDPVWQVNFHKQHFN